MAETFTGLKLQGDIGKFGKVDLSDVCGYVKGLWRGNPAKGLWRGNPRTV
jgi:hypothetical protein